MIPLKSTEQGLLLQIRAQPGARRNSLTGIHNGRLKVAVTQIAEKGKANQEIIKLLASVLKVSKSQVKLVSGQTSPQKTVLISGVDEHRIRETLTTALE